MRKDNKILAIGLAAAMAMSLTACGTSITGVSMNNTPDTLESGKTVHISAEYAYTGSTPETSKAEELIDALGLTYTSSNPDIISVDENGNMKALAPGRADITITSADGKISAEKSVTVIVSASGIKMPDSVKMAMDDPTAMLNAKAVPENATDAHLSFKFSDESVVKVDGKGALSAVSEGVATIVATIDGTGISEECKVTVLPSAEEVTLADTQISMAVDETKDLTFTVTPENACTDYASWYSSDDSIATVDENGKVTAHAAGTCEISLAISDKTATCKVTVKGNAKATDNTASSSTPAPQAGDTSQPVAQTNNNADAAASAAPASGGNNNTSASSVAPAAGAGHGQWTVFGDGQARTLMNNLRASLGLGELAWNDALGDVAAARCQQLMDDFSHNGMTAPEICAMGTTDAASTVAAWQGSSAHYAQMTNPSYTQVAIAHCYDGDGCHYWCATFG